MNYNLKFEENDLIGTVSYVDTAQVLIDIENSNVMSFINVGSIVAIETTMKHVFSVGLIEKVTRKFSSNWTLIEVDSEDESQLDGFGSNSSDALKVNMIGMYKTVDGDKRDVFKRGIDNFPQLDNKCFILQSENLQNFMNIINTDISKEKQLKIGTFALDSAADAILDGDKFFQRHAAILGSTGSGKSWCVANLLEKASELEYPNIILFDMHGEYKSMCVGEERIAEQFKIAGPGDLDSEDERMIFLPYWLLNREEMLSMILDRSDNNAPNQASRFTLHIRSLKEETLGKEDKLDIAKTFTVDSPIPFDIKELIKLLNDDDTKKGVGKNGAAVKGDWEGKLTRFISRLESKIEDKRYGFMFQPSEGCQEYNWLNSLVCELIGAKANSKGIKIIDFSEVPSDVLPVITGTIARLLFDVQLWLNDEYRTPFAIVCDEAHLYLPLKEDADSVQKQALYNFERIAKEGRKYGISLVAVSQRPSDVSKTILSQCNNFIVLRLTNDRDKSVIKNLLPDGLKGVLEQLPLLDVGEAVAVGDAILLPSRIQLRKPDHKPMSATKNFWTDWEKNQPNNKAIQIAVENMRSQTKLSK